MSRPRSVTLLNWLPSMDVDFSELASWIDAASAMTVIVSDVLPMASSILAISRVSFAATTMLFCVNCLNPAAFTVTEYVPGERFKKRNRPVASVAPDRLVPVLVSVKVTGAFGTTAFAGSTTVPCNELDTVCADRQTARSVKMHRISASLLIGFGIYPPKQIWTCEYLAITPKKANVAVSGA